MGHITLEWNGEDAEERDWLDLFHPKKCNNEMIDDVALASEIFEFEKIVLLSPDVMNGWGLSFGIPQSTVDILKERHVNVDLEEIPSKSGYYEIMTGIGMEEYFLCCMTAIDGNYDAEPPDAPVVEIPIWTWKDVDNEV